MKTKNLISFCVFFFCALTISAQKHNALTNKEKAEGWTLLFDGKSITGWRQCNKTEMAKNWIIEDEAMKVQAGSVPGRGSEGDILYASKKYGNFVLSIDWKIAKEGNSGIFYNIVEYPGKPIYIAAPEVQILDNWNAGDNRLSNHLAGSLYDMLPALPSNAKPAGEWNNIIITVDHGKVSHIQNGELVCRYELWSPQWEELLKKSKFKDWPEFVKGIAKEGYIGLQDHGYDCWFRNIKIKELK